MNSSKNFSSSCKNEFIRRHNEMKKDIESLESIPDMVHVSFTHETKRPEASFVPTAPLRDLLPIHCSSLVPGVVHERRLLRGTLIVHPIFMTAVHTVLEDEVGGVVWLSLYLKAQSNQRTLNREGAKKLFCQGAKLAVLQPYYKLAMDGKYLIQVKDFFQNVVFLDAVGHCDTVGWRKEAKAHFSQYQFKEALHCFSKAIEGHSESSIAAVLLSNCASALLAKNDFRCSLLFAVASISVTDSKFRPFYSAGFALKGIGRHDLVYSCVENCLRLKAPLTFSRHLKAGLKTPKANRMQPDDWNRDVLPLVATQQPLELLSVTVLKGSSCQSLKSEGNDLFKKKFYDDALNRYCSGLHTLSDLALLLNNKAMCYIKLEMPVDAFFLASASILVMPRHIKAHYWKAESLVRLGFQNEAKHCLEAAIKINGPSEVLTKQYAKLTKSAVNRQASSQNDVREEKSASEMKWAEAENDGSLPVPYLIEINAVRERLSQLGVARLGQRFPEELRLDVRISPFHQEIAKGDLWPKGSDVEKSAKVLRRAYEEARAPDACELMILCKQVQLSDFDILKRLHSNEEHVVQWWKSAELKSISPRKRQAYSSTVYQSFTNCAVKKKVLLGGRSHIAVGFVDLSELLFAEIRQNSSKTKPLRWIGYEASAYALAKSLVISKMLKTQQDASHILQVWYSATWKTETFVAFREALSGVLEALDKNADGSYPAAVTEVLEHWNVTSVPLARARSKWLFWHSMRSNTEVANFQRKVDRIALCRYLLSGDIMEGDLGSTVMFSFPRNVEQNTFEIALDEWFMHCLQLHDIFKHVDDSTSVVDAAADIIRNKIVVLATKCRQGVLDIKIKYGFVSPNNNTALDEIKQHSAKTISWNNLCDYIPSKDFHEMAWKCSGPDTVHHLYSMNWSTEVKGAHVMDYDLEAWNGIFLSAKRCTTKHYHGTGLGKYLLNPPITHLYNLGISAIAPEMYPSWTDAFFIAANLKDRSKQTKIECNSSFDVLARMTGALYMAYTFSASVDLLDELDH